MQIDNPYAWVLLFTVITVTAAMPFVWSRRGAPGARPFLALLAGIAIWCFCYAGELFSMRLEQMITWVKLEYIGIVVVVNAFLLVVVEYSGRSHWIKRRTLIWLMIHPLLITALVMTNDNHHLILKSYAIFEINGLWLLHVTEHGAMFWVHVVYTYLTLVASTAILIEALRRGSPLYQGQVVPILVAATVPWISNAVYIFGGFPFDLTPLAMTLSAGALAVSLWRYHLFDAVPVAREWLVDHMDDAVVVVDELGRIVDINQAVWSLLRYQSTQTISRNVAEKPWESLFSPWKDQLAPLLTTREVRGEINLGKSNLPHWYEVRVSPLLSHTSKKPAVQIQGVKILIFHDIQDRKQSEEMMADARDQALQANLMKSQMLANVSHELRTPLNAILGFSEMILDGGYGALSDVQVNLIQQVLQSAQQMDRFITDLLDQALIEKGKLSLYISEFHPTDLLAGVRSLVDRSAQEKGVELTFQIDRNLPEILLGDIQRLQQVLINLVNNAIKYTDQGEIAVHLHCQENSWSIEVMDTGIGIPPEALGLIFEPFRQVDRQEGQKRGGAGLGLSIVRYLVTMMSGMIEVKSEVGIGSTFLVTLPMIEEKKEAE